MDASEIDITADLVDGTEQLNAAGADAAVNRPTDLVLPHEVEIKPNAVESIRDSLTRAFKGDDSVSDVKTDVPLVLTKQGDKYHRPDGTFATQDEITAFEAVQQPTEQNQGALEMPANFTALEQEQFKSLPTELQQYVARTTQDLNTRASLYSEYDLMEQIIAPRRAAFAQDGVTAPVALANLFQLSDFAGRAPEQFILWFASQRGIDLDALLDAVDEQQQGQDPRIGTLQAQVTELTNRFNGQTQSAVDATVQENRQLVETFAVEKDDKGVLLRPHFAELVTEIQANIPLVQRQNPSKTLSEILQQAYENACWQNPAVRAKMQQVAKPDAQQHVQKAKQANVGGGGTEPNGVNSTNKPSDSNLTLRQEIENAVAAASA